MDEYKYLIVGASMAGDAAARGIRELDPSGSVAILGAEPDPPYARPPLSKGLWKGRPLEKIWRGTEKLNVELRLGRVVTGLHPASKTLRDDHGDEYSYEKLLLAVGGSPARLPFGGDHIIYYRTLRDYERLRALSQNRLRFLVIGGGFIGSEIAAALCMHTREVTMVFMGDSIGAGVFPPDLSHVVSDFYREKGVELLPDDTVTSLEDRTDGLVLRTRGGRTLEVDAVVAGIGIHPNLDLARSAGLKIDDGIVVDDHQRTSLPDIFAAGDVARFPHHALGRLVRVEHEDNAVQMGKQAGRNMAGADEAYIHTPYFFSDLFELGYEAVGDLDAKLRTFADWQAPFEKGVIYYLDGDRLRGVLLWGVWDKHKAAAALLTSPGPFTPEALRGRIQG